MKWFVLAGLVACSRAPAPESGAPDDVAPVEAVDAPVAMSPADAVSPADVASPVTP